MTEHSKLFGFSSAHRWASGRCPGSVQLCADEPDTESDISREGSACHWLAEKMLNEYKQRIDSNGVPKGQSLIGQVADNGVVIDEDVFDAALVYYTEITSVVVDKTKLHVESKVAAPSLDEEAFGTSDASYFDDQSNTLYVWDLKYGFKGVDAFENLQLTGYAQATCETLGLTALSPRLSLSIVQPRCFDGKGACRTWDTNYKSLQSLVVLLRGGIVEHRSGVAEAHSGEWCLNCRGMYKCPANIAACAGAIDHSCEPTPVTMTNDSLSYELTVAMDALERLADRVAMLEVRAADVIIDKGEFLPGFRMENRMGRKKWDKTNEEVIMLGELFGVDFSNPPTAVSPSKAMTELKKKGVDETVIKDYYSVPKIGLKLVKDDNSRSKQIFSNKEA